MLIGPGGGRADGRAFILGIPVFFDVAFIILAPIVSVSPSRQNPSHEDRAARRRGAAHCPCGVATTPRSVAAAALLNADVGLVTVVGLVICAIVGVVGFFAAKLFDVDKLVPGSSPATEAIAEDALSADASAETKDTVPSAAMVVMLILLPILLIMIDRWR